MAALPFYVDGSQQGKLFYAKLQQNATTRFSPATAPYPDKLSLARLANLYPEHLIHRSSQPSATFSYSH